MQVQSSADGLLKKLTSWLPDPQAAKRKTLLERSVGVIRGGLQGHSKPPSVLAGPGQRPPTPTVVCCACRFFASLDASASDELLDAGFQFQDGARTYSRAGASAAAARRQAAPHKFASVASIALLGWAKHASLPTCCRVEGAGGGHQKGAPGLQVDSSHRRHRRRRRLGGGTRAGAHTGPLGRCTCTVLECC